jgi:hypothetical protein
MARTPTSPPDHPGMWRRLAARAHLDAGGDHELFIWTVATREAICGSELGGGVLGRERHEQPSRHRETSTPGTDDRVPFDKDALLEVLTDRALAMADAVAEPYGNVLRQVADCHPADAGPLLDQQRRGASYRSLAAIGHRVGMTKDERIQWYSIAEAIPLSQRHVGHILSRLKRRVA